MKYAKTLGALICSAILGMGVTACQKEGPLEKAGESLDKAGRTIKNGGKETTADKIDDAADDLKKDAKKLAK